MIFNYALMLLRITQEHFRFHRPTETLKVEVERLCKSGVLRKVNRSEWAAPTFIIPKKDGSVRFISDFRELKKWIRRKPFPIPKIQDMLLKLEGFKYATSLILNKGCYHIQLSPHSKELCTIVLPWGKYMSISDYQWAYVIVRTSSKRKCQP
jgi:hypothetical protein